MTGRPNDERAPLLDRDAQAEAGETPDTAQEKRAWWTIGWYTVFALLGVFVLGVFVKGVIDSDDVDVSSSFATESSGDTLRGVLGWSQAYMCVSDAKVASGKGCHCKNWS